MNERDREKSVRLIMRNQGDLSSKVKLFIIYFSRVFEGDDVHLWREK